MQLPLDCDTKIDQHLITDSVSPDKDVDGYVVSKRKKTMASERSNYTRIIIFCSLNTINEGRVAIGDLGGFLPCTPNGCIELIKRSGIPIAGADAVVLGRSKIVGTPVAELLKWNHATVTVCHSKTRNLQEVVSLNGNVVISI